MKVTARVERDRRHLTRLSTDASRTATEGRLALLRSKTLLEMRTRDITISVGDDGVEIYDRIKLTYEDRLSNLRAARVWATKCANEIRHLEAQIDKAIEVAERMV